MRYLSKGFFAIILLALLFSIFAFAIVSINAQEYEERIDAAYQWLADEVDKGWGATEENAFSVMALKNYDNTLAEQGTNNLLYESKNNGECWPDGLCKIKDTALAIIALHEMNADTSKALDWLVAHKKSSLATDNWFLQFEITGGEAGTCYVDYLYRGNEKRDKILIMDDRKVRVSGFSSCFQIKAGKPWWLNINEYCLDTKFYVKCDEPSWIANLLFNDDITFIPYPTVSETTPEEPAEERWLNVKNKCFPSTYIGNCDYASTLWASYALSLYGIDPETRAYLESNADVNAPLSYSLIYLTRKDTEFANKLADDQNGAFGYWDGTDALFRTAMAFYALRDLGIANLDMAKDWLLGKQNNDYSWSTSIKKQRDTAAILYSVFPLEPIIPEETCEEEGYFCCLRAAAGADVDYDLSVTCGYDEVCASECLIYADDICGDVEGITSVCCDEAAGGAELYSELDDTCNVGQVCASACVEETCVGEGYECCPEGQTIGERYEYLDDSCPVGKVCSWGCEGIEVPEPFDFSIAAYPASNPIDAGQSAEWLVYVWLYRGETENVFLNLTAFNSTNHLVNFSEEIGDFSFTPASGMPFFVSTLRVDTIDSSNGTFTLNISATNGSLTHSTSVQLLVKGKGEDGGLAPTQRCSSFEDLGYICCPRDKIKTGAQEYFLSCAPDYKTCVLEEDCLEEPEPECGILRGICCVEAGVYATLYHELNYTCSSGEVCASACKVSSPTQPQQTCSGENGICCKEASSWAYTHGQLNCAVGEICASSCATTTTVTEEEREQEVIEEERGGFLLFLIWFLIILVVIGLIILAYFLIKKRKKKSKPIGIPGIGMGKMPPPPKRPIPLFKKPGTPLGAPFMPGPGLRPRPLSKPLRPSPGQVRPLPLPPIRPMFTKVTPPKLKPIKLPIKPVIVPIKTTKITKKRKEKTESELAKTLKELKKIAKAKAIRKK